jgi:hypothetical protein
MGASNLESEIYCHLVPGRLRLKLPALKGSRQVAERLAGTTRSLPGVTDATANPTTGSLLVLFDPRQTDHTTIVTFLRERGEIDPKAILTTPAPPVDSRGQAWKEIAWSAGSAIGKEVLKGALSQVLRGSPLSLLLEIV